MTDINQAIEVIVQAVKETKGLAQILQLTPIGRDKLEEISAISPPTKLALKGLDCFFESASPTDRRSLPAIDVSVSNDGKFYRLSTGELLHPFWHDGEMRLRIGNIIKRCSVMVAQAFQIRSDTANNDNIIAYKDGDRRNLTPENLYWIDGEDGNQKILLVEDICRRLIENEWDIDLTFDMYRDSSPTISREYVQSILKKEAFASITDKFFVIENGKYKSVIDSDASTLSGLDCYGLLKQTKDIELVNEMLRRKVGLNQKIDEPEITIMIVNCDDGVDHKAGWYSEKIKAEYGADINPAVIGQILTKKNQTLYKTITSVWEAKSS